MSFLVKQLSASYDSCPLNTAIAITGTSSALYGMMGARKLNQGDLATLNGAILLAGVPVSIIVGTKIISDNVNNSNKPTLDSFKKFGWMAAPAAISIALGIVSMIVPSKKTNPKICWDDSCSSSSCSDSSSDCSSDDDDDCDDDHHHGQTGVHGRHVIKTMDMQLAELIEVLRITKLIQDSTNIEDIKTLVESLSKFGYVVGALDNIEEMRLRGQIEVANKIALLKASEFFREELDDLDKKTKESIKGLIAEACEIFEGDDCDCDGASSFLQSARDILRKFIY